jgi:hypothetical protein
LANQEARELIHRARNYDVNRIRFKNPFIPILRFTVGTGLEILVTHQRRHLLQAERIRQSIEFPQRERSPNVELQQAVALRRHSSVGDMVFPARSDWK